MHFSWYSLSLRGFRPYSTSELAPPLGAAGGLYTRELDNPTISGQKIHLSAAQGLGANGLATIFKKMDVGAAFLEAPSGRLALTRSSLSRFAQELLDDL